MNSFLRSLAMKVPAFRAHKQRVDVVQEERDRLAAVVDDLTTRVEEMRKQLEKAGVFEAERESQRAQAKADWIASRNQKQKLSEEFRKNATVWPLSYSPPPVEPGMHVQQSVRDWVQRQVEAERYWFQRIEVLPGLFSNGWSDPQTEKLPYFGLPKDLTGKRVLDIGCAEGFFSFEAERRGAREVISIDSFPESIRRFNIVKAARQSSCMAFLMNVYDLEPRRLGTFDLVLFYGVFYHLKHPQHALERIQSVCTGDLLFQTHIAEDPAIVGVPWARFFPHGMKSGTGKMLFDPTVFWLFNSECCLAMLDHVGFTDLKVLSNDPQPFVVSARSPNQAPGVPPDQSESPWC